MSVFASDKAKRVIGVELNKDAVRDAKINAKKNEVENITFYAEDAGRFMEQVAREKSSVDVVFMDPPRNGSSEQFLKSLLILKPKKVVYVSCGPDTLARDLKILTKGGYKVKKAECVDMFPHAALEHVETVCLLER